MAHFDKFDICDAYSLLECDYNSGGILWERPLCRHKRESIGVVLDRMQYSPGAGRGTYESLSSNAREIYWQAVKRLGLPVHDTVDQIRFRHYAG